jgi:hypothetical protein
MATNMAKECASVHPPIISFAEFIANKPVSSRPLSQTAPMTDETLEQPSGAFLTPHDPAISAFSPTPG